ncbi:integrase [Mariprofundus aestuarium]|uniref:Integrase n=1 Tax=Mariprofundus aestuarium TaxID=1921086 RepID=A0A2K8KYA5_MARES|nr:integrase [Mariprofundus aestuarium]
MGAKLRGKSIQVDFSYQGQRCRETLKLEPTKAHLLFAERKHATILHEIAIGTFDYRKHFPNSKRALQFSGSQSGTQLVKDALLSYLADKKIRIANSTYGSYETAVRCHLIPAFGQMRVEDLSTQVIRHWLGGLTTIKNKRINNVLIPLRAILDDAFADGSIDRNPMDRIKNLKVRTREPEPFDDVEQLAIVSAASDQGIANAIQFGFWTGLRIGELIALRWSDIDWRSDTVHIRHNNVRGLEKGTKTEAGNRSIDLLLPALKALQCQKKITFNQNDYVFHNPNTNRNWNDDIKFRKIAWEPTVKRAKIHYREPKQMRHTYASMMLTAGENIAWVSQQLGHTSIQTTLKRYARWIPKMNNGSGTKAVAMFSKSTQNDTILAQKKTEARKLPSLLHLYGGASGTRTPDTWIMIPPL